MTWLAGIGVTGTALLVWRLAVPQVRVDDPAAPHFGSLVSWRSSVVLAVAALLLSQVLWIVPVPLWWLWLPYLALGLPLIAVDLLTTYLPKRLNWMALILMSGGTVALATKDMSAALGAVLGALAAFGFFYVAWRSSTTLGFGDVRLALLIGAVAGAGGLQSWTTSLLAGTVVGALYGIGHVLWARRDASRPRHFAFGPALWLGPLVAAALLR